MHHKLLLFLALIAITPFSTKAQETFPDSRELITRAMDMASKEEYKRAADIYKQINESDTNYAVAVYQQIYVMMADSQLVAAKQLAASSVNLRYGNKRAALGQLATCYYKLGYNDSALTVYDTLIKLYPHDAQFWYQKGAVYLLMKDYDAAEACFKKSICINPFFGSGHLLLGNTYAITGRLTESMMALGAALMVSRDEQVAKSAVSTLSAIAEQTDSVTKAYVNRKEKYNDGAYAEIDQIIHAKIALDPSYKSKTSVDNAIFRQMQAMMEKLVFVPGNNNFSMQVYVPVFVELQKQDMLDGAMLKMFIDRGYSSINSAAKRKDGEMKEAKEVVVKAFIPLQKTREPNIAMRKDASSLYHYLLSDTLIFVGEVNDDPNNFFFKGDVSIFRADQTLYSTRHFTNKGKEDGTWKYYYASGILKKEEQYKDGVFTGTVRNYSANGCPSSEGTIDENGKLVSLNTYDYRGWKNQTIKYPAPEEMAQTTYYKSGNVATTLHYTKKQIDDGEYTDYHDNSKVSKLYHFKKGQYDGAYREYLDNGMLNEEGEFDNGVSAGPYKHYYTNGVLRKKTTDNHNTDISLCELFYDNGLPMETYSFKKNDREGADKKYDIDGKLYCEQTYNKGRLVAVKYFDKAGNVFYEKQDKNRLREYAIYYPNGNKYADIKADNDGHYLGTVTFNYTDGGSRAEASYEDGNRVGKGKTFYQNGVLQSEVSYKGDKLDGYCKYYHANGLLRSAGWYKEDKKQGQWKDYYINGALASDIFFLNGSTNGNYKDYNVKGELMYKYIYDNDMLIGSVSYDSTGRVVDSITFPQGNGNYLIHNKNGKPFMEQEGVIIYGYTTGPFVTRYMNGKDKTRLHFTNGISDSVCTYYHPNGKVAKILEYRNNLQTGKAIYYNEVGELMREVNYKEGQRNGRYDIYMGKRLTNSYNDKDGDDDSAQVYYGEEGKVAIITYFSRGSIVGYTYEGSDGKLLPMKPLKSGTGKLEGFYSNGKKSAEMAYDKSERVGTTKIYFSNGILEEEFTHVNGLLNGPDKQYAPNGKLIDETNYKDGEETGTENTYDNNGVLIISKGWYCGVQHGLTIINDPVTHKTSKYTYRYGEVINVEE